MQNQNDKQEGTGQVIAPRLTPGPGVRRVTKRGKQKAAPPLKGGEEEEIKRTLNPSPKAHITGEGDQEEKYNLCLGQRKEGKLAPDYQGIKKKPIKTPKRPQSHSAFTRASTKGGMTEVSTHPQ